jgi:hypothetical protein
MLNRVGCAGFVGLLPGGSAGFSLPILADAVAFVTIFVTKLEFRAAHAHMPRMIDIVLPNTPNAVNRTIDCTFDQSGLEVTIRIPAAVQPATSPGVEQLEARRILVAVARTIIEEFAE